MADNVTLVILITAVIIVIIMLVAVMGVFQLSLADYTERDDWDEIVFYAILAVLAMVALSFLNLGITDEPISISLNVTGVLIPTGIVIFLMITRRLDYAAALISIGLVAIVGFPLTQVLDGGAYIFFPFWLIPAGIAAGCGFFFTRNKDPETVLIRGGAIAFAAGCLGMFIGGDLLHLPEMLDSGGTVLVMGAGGILDFTFLTGVVALSILWCVQGGVPALKRFLNSKNESDITS
jgi:uncharacterized membrane protein